MSKIDEAVEEFEDLIKGVKARIEQQRTTGEPGAEKAVQRC